MDTLNLSYYMQSQRKSFNNPPAILGAGFCKVLGVAMLALSMAACTSGKTVTTDSGIAYPNDSAASINASGIAALRRADFAEARKRFLAVASQYPQAPENASASLCLLYLYYYRENYTAAINLATRLLLIDPASHNADYIYFIRGLSLGEREHNTVDKLLHVNLSSRDLSNLELANKDFAAILKQFPHSKYAPAAHQYLVHNQNLLAKHELQIAKFYYSRHQCAAVLKRAHRIVNYYASTLAVKDAQILINKCENR